MGWKHGEDFKLNVVGENEIGFINVEGGDYTTNLHITGYGFGYQHLVAEDSTRITAKRFQVIEGENQTYTLGGNGITFRINADYSLFSEGGKVLVDGKEITDYTSKEGSTVIILNKEYAEKLSEGEHSIRVTFNNGNYAEANFNVQAEETSNPKTGDSVMFYVILFGLSTCSFIYSKKRFLNYNE